MDIVRWGISMNELMKWGSLERGRERERKVFDKLW
jgi:hypothetical protein